MVHSMCSGKKSSNVFLLNCRRGILDTEGNTVAKTDQGFERINLMSHSKSWI